MDYRGPREPYGNSYAATGSGSHHQASSADTTYQRPTAFGSGGAVGWNNRHHTHTNSNSDNGGGGSDEHELATRTISIYPKRFYFDVKENNRGRFIKMAEIGFGRKKSRLILAMSAAAEFRDKLGEVIAAANQLPIRGSADRSNPGLPQQQRQQQQPHDEYSVQKSRIPSGGSKRKQEQTTTSSDDSGGRGDNINSKAGKDAGHSSATYYGGNMYGNDDDDTLISIAMVRDNRRYFFDLKENYRGRFLRISQSGTSGRTTIAIPAEGLKDFQAAITELLQSFASQADLEPVAVNGGGSTADASASTANTVNAFNNATTPLVVFQPESELPEATVVRHRDKSFYFDVRRNPRGVFLRLTEAKAAQRTQLVIPDQLWPRFHEIFSQLNTHLQQNSVSLSGAGGDKLSHELSSTKADSNNCSVTANVINSDVTSRSEETGSGRSSTASTGGSFEAGQRNLVDSNDVLLSKEASVL